MGFKKTLEERMQGRNEALEKLRERSKVQVARPQKKKPQRTGPKSKVVDAQPPPAATEILPIEFHSPRLASADGSVPLYVTPWAAQLAVTLLECARDGKVAIRLLWPADIDTVVTLHSVAVLSQVLGTHLTGLRTLYYPGTDATWARLDRITADRGQYDELCKAFYNGAVPKKASEALRTVLDICHEANYATSKPLLRIRQLIPAFRFDRSSDHWVGVREAPIDTLIKKIPKAALKQQLRERLSASNWNAPTSAPGAVLVLHREIKKKDLKDALNRGGAKTTIDAILIDASSQAIKADPASVKNVPRHLQTINEVCDRQVGALIVTNDPTEFRVRGKELEKIGFKVDWGILAAEAEGADWLASRNELPASWKPETRALVNFKIKSTDEEARRLARQIRRIIDAVRQEGPEIEEPLVRALHLVQRASLVPGGISDVQSSDEGGWSPLAHQLDANKVELLIQDAIARGHASTQQTQIKSALKSIREHLAACADTTPLAEQLKAAIERRVVKDKEEMTIVIFSPRDIAIAQQYLARKLRDKWTAAQGLVQWLSLTEALTKLPDRSSDYRLTIVGLNARILRFLVAHKNVPLHTTLLVPSHQVVRMLQPVQFLCGVEVLKPYKSRLDQLYSGLKACAGDTADIELLARAHDTRLPASAHQLSGPSGGSDPTAYRLFLDDGRSLSASGTVFVYDSSEATFHRTQVKDLVEGDSIFEMTDELRDEVEAAFNTQFKGFKFTSARSPLDVYRALLRQAVEQKFPEANLSEQIAKLQVDMAKLNPACSAVSGSKLRYWLTLPNQEEDSAPHAARDKGEYLTFCKALLISSDLAELCWSTIKQVRVLNQLGGRQVNALYSEILLSPESAKIYRGIRSETLQMLQSRVLDCVSQVVRIEPPAKQAQD